jgi:hypothetical protein
MAPQTLDPKKSGKLKERDSRSEKNIDPVTKF